MSVREVKLITCDSCKTEIAVDLLAYDIPDKWLHVQGCGDLCETCAHRFKSFVMDLFDGSVPSEWSLPRCY